MSLIKREGKKRAKAHPTLHIKKNHLDKKKMGFHLKGEGHMSPKKTKEGSRARIIAWHKKEGRNAKKSTILPKFPQEKKREGPPPRKGSYR